MDIKTDNADRRYRLPCTEAEKLTGITQQQVSKWRERLREPDKYRDTLYGAAYRKAMAQRGQTDQRGASGTGLNEWYTPLQYIEAARDVLGAIDLDPASSKQAQETVQAERFFTPEENGLEQEWNGRIWLNPPYAQPFIAEFFQKMVDEGRMGYSLVFGIFTSTSPRPMRKHRRA